jgi:hypothetical protein
MYYCADSSNMEASESGIIKYPGAASVLSAALSGAPTITGIFEYRKTDGTLIEVACAGTKVYTVAGGVATQIYSGITAGKFFQQVQFGNVLILMNGTDSLLQYDGSTCSAITFVDPQSIWNNAKPKGAGLFRGSIFYFGDPTYPDRVYKPAPGTYDNFDDSNNTVEAFDVEPGGPGGVTGFKALNDDIAVIYKLRSIHLMSGVNPFGSGIDEIQIRDLTRETGCIAPRTIQQIGSTDHIFLAENGLRQISVLLNQNGGIKPELQPTYNIQTSINALNYTGSTIENACAVYYQPTNRYYLAVPTGSNTQNDTLYVYDVMTKTCEPGSWINAACLGIYNRFIYLGGYAGQLYKFGSGNAWGTSAITGFWESFWIMHNGFNYNAYRRLNLYAEGTGATDIVVRWGVLQLDQEIYDQATESVNSGSLWDSATWDSAMWSTGNRAIFSIKNLGRGTAFKLRLTNATTDQQPKIRGIELHWEPFGAARG